MLNKSVKIDITDEKGKALVSYEVKRVNVAANARRMKMNAEIIDSDFDDKTKKHLFTSAALACVLHDEKGELCYVGDDAYDKLFNDLDIEVYDLLAKAYVEINPFEKTLSAKKKKS